jgi:GNAT superfamily N-acetyltransferase
MRTDHWHHETLIALRSGPRLPVGIADYVRAERFDVAEAAIVVADGFQHLGVGTALIEALRVRAVLSGVRRMRATMIGQNLGARALVAHLGEVQGLRRSGDVLELEVRL